MREFVLTHSIRVVRNRRPNTLLNDTVTVREEHGIGMISKRAFAIVCRRELTATVSGGRRCRLVVDHRVDVERQRAVVRRARVVLVALVDCVLGARRYGCCGRRWCDEERRHGHWGRGEILLF
jgi:hypothetical protein